jgi:hypothetical protein
LQRYAFVKAVDFSKLTRASDALGVLGLMNEDVLSFSQYPREHQTRIAHEDREMIDRQIIQALKEFGLIKPLVDGQMYS